MPATSDTEVFNFEGNMEKSCYDFLLAEGLELATANDPQRLGDDYVGVQFSVGGIADDEHMIAKPDGNLEFNHYLFTMDITIHTDRSENSVPGAAFSRYHRELVAKVRNLLSISRAAQGASLNDQLTLYWINRLIPSDTSYTPYDTSHDETVLSFTGDFTIQDDAFPV